MRNFFHLFFGVAFGVGALATARPAAAQAGNEATASATLQWGSFAEVRGREGLRRVPTFKGAAHGFGQAVGTFSLRLPGGTVGQGELRNAVYKPFTAQELRLLGNVDLPAAPALSLRYGTETRQPVSYLLVQPVRRNPQTGQAERLVSFEYAYRFEPAGDGPARRGSSLTARTHAPNSVLRAGDWFKIGVPQSGVYKLDKGKLRDLGLPVSTLDPRNLQLFGNATGLLPQPNATPRPDDLLENNVLFVGNNDNVFDDNEYFLFYARGPHVWQPVGNTGFRHVNHLYADTAYYFVTVGAAGRRVPTAAAVSRPATATINTFLARAFHEHDLVNLLRSGRRWLGEGLAPGTQKTFVFNNLPDLVPGGQAQITAAVAAASGAAGQFQVALNGQTVGGLTTMALSTFDYHEVANTDTRTFALPLPGGLPADVPVTLTFNTGDATATGYLDYLEVLLPRQLRLNGAQLEFRSLENRVPNAVSRFVVANLGSGAQVWDVTNPARATAQALDANGGFNAFTDSLREYVAVQPGGQFDAPRLFGRVPNQNLHALNLNGQLDVVIVTYPPFRAEAERLAQHRRSQGLQVAVATTREVYNEFSSGAQDITAIRDLMKQVYDRNPDPTAKRLSLLLFGDASFDYKSSPFNDASQEPSWWRERAPFRTDADFDRANQNYVPTYESRESFSPFGASRPNREGDNSYSSEDYYGLLDDNEGEWPELTGAGSTYETCDIGIGRLPVRTPKGQPRDATQARQMVDKLIAYDGTVSFGKWRNRLTLTADDGDNSVYATESETIINQGRISPYPIYNVRKAYLDLYPQVTVAAGQRSPDCEAAIDQSLEQGSLMLSYMGHGGPRGLADEQIVTNASVLGLQNQNRYTLCVTGTCDFSTYDNPDFTSAGEQMLTDNATGGAMALFTTTRVVNSFNNTELVSNFYEQILRPGATGTRPTLGHATRVAKNNSPGGDLNNRNYTLLSDPSATLAYPKQAMVIDSVNGRAVVSPRLALDTLKALARVRLSGRVLRNNALDAGFNGTADVTVYDKPDSVQTLGDQGAPPVWVKRQENVIYGGQASVRGGLFSVRFVVPKDLNYNAGLGKISLYAADPARVVDAGGYQLVPVGGAARLAARDTIPPKVQLAMDNEQFVSGGLTGLSPTLLARLSDNVGINTSNAGIGHELTATLDNDPTKLTVLNETYTADVDNSAAGRARYLYKELTPGPHVLKVKAWDTSNNSGEGTVEFIAASNENLALDHVLNYPNPFSNVTTFHFDHNRAGDDLDVQVQIFTVSGKLVKTLRGTFANSAPHQQGLTWNGRDDYDDQLARGVYVYRVSVRSPRDGQVASKFEKLVILN